MEERGLRSLLTSRNNVDGWKKRGVSVLFLLEEDKVLSAFALEDRVREEARQVVDTLHALGIKVAMITGDAEQVAAAVADELGIDEYFAEVLPEHKDSQVAELQERGHRVAMVGDGVNNAPRSRVTTSASRSELARTSRSNSRSHPCLGRPPSGRRRHQAVEGFVPEDGSEPRMGDRL
jgi:high-affinity K+ transport system ATPase subunit B